MKVTIEDAENIITIEDWTPDIVMVTFSSVGDNQPRAVKLKARTARELARQLDQLAEVSHG